MRFAFSLSVLALIVGTAAGQEPPINTLQEQTRTVVARAEKSVVTIVVGTGVYPNQLAADIQAGKLGGYGPRSVESERDPLDLSRPDQAMNCTIGNGVVLTAEGLILTPYHLLEGATKIYVHIGAGKGSYADIHAADARSDLAVLRLLEPPAGLVPVVVPKSLPGRGVASKGDFAIAISCIAGEAPSASIGLVAATDKKIYMPVEPMFGPQPPQPLVAYPTLLQIDARTARGTSGGGIFNLKGECIGLTTALAAVSGSDQAPGYAIPMDGLYRPIIAALRDGREVEYGFLGISWQGRGMGRRFGAPDPFFTRSAEGGIMIQAVTAGMPAAEAGLEPGDVLIGVNGVTIANQDDMQFRIAASLANVETRLTVRRSGRPTETVSLILAKANNPFPWIASKRPEPVFGLRVDQLSTLLQDLVGREQNQRYIESIPRGVVISDIERGSPADKAFSEPNRKFVVTKVNGRTVRTPDEFYAAARGALRVQLTVARVGDLGSRPLEVTLP
jgi:serine protease Do